MVGLTEAGSLPSQAGRPPMKRRESRRRQGMSDLIRELRRLLDTGAVSRGADYQVRGRVVSAEVDPRGEAARGEVAGSGGRGYVQDIALEWAVDGRLVEVDGACSCP